MIVLLGLWIGFFVIHSTLASLRLKNWVARHWPLAMPYYRIAFNIVALVLVLPLLHLTFTLSGPTLWRWDGLAGWIADGLAIVAVGTFAWSLRYYDGAEFLGLRQIREHERRVEDQEHFHISPMHRFVRHPWYTMALLIIWTRDMDMAFFLSSVAATLYFFIGSRLEERKLIAYHGDAYRRYRERVPGLVPLPWHYLDRDTAQALVSMAVRPVHRAN